MKYKDSKFERIKDMRIEKDLSQKSVSQKLSIAQNTLSQYESGMRNIPNEILIQIAILYETSIDYLLELTDDPKPYNRKNQ